MANPQAPTRRRSLAAVVTSAEVLAESDTSGESITLAPPVPRVTETVTVVVPRPFTLTLDNFQPVPYEAGVQEMPVDHASHWFARAQGVKVYTTNQAA